MQARVRRRQRNLKNKWSFLPDHMSLTASSLSFHCARTLGLSECEGVYTIAFARQRGLVAPFDAAGRARSASNCSRNSLSRRANSSRAQAAHARASPYNSSNRAVNDLLNNCCERSGSSIVSRNHSVSSSTSPVGIPRARAPFRDGALGQFECLVGILCWHLFTRGQVGNFGFWINVQ